MLLIEAMIAEAPWKATDYIDPHEYIMIWQHPKLCSAMTRVLLEKGYNREFLGRQYRYVDIGEYRYWSMGKILNRARNNPK